jgi:LPXTG-motif cell wall-anchored protein
MIRRFRSSRVLFIAVAVGTTCTLVGGSPAAAQQAPVGLGTSASFAVLAGTTVTNTGPSVISGDVGVSPGTAITGFPPGIVNNGTIHAADAVAAQAQADLTTAYNDAAGRSTTATVTADLAGQTLVSGVYTGATLGLTGTVTLDAQGDPNAVFIFQAASTLITASSSVVALTNGADACNVYWQVGSSATLGTTSTFVGTVLALTSITATTSATINGRLLARNGAVTLDSNIITNSACGASTSTPTTTQAPTTTAAAVPSTTVAAGLPRTGRSTVPLLVLASGLVLVGGIFMAARRRNHA